MEYKKFYEDLSAKRKDILLKKDADVLDYDNEVFNNY